MKSILAKLIAVGMLCGALAFAQAAPAAGKKADETKKTDAGMGKGMAKGKAKGMAKAKAKGMTKAKATGKSSAKATGKAKGKAKGGEAKKGGDDKK